MKNLLVLFIALLTSYTAQANPINKSDLQAVLSKTLQADVKIIRITPTANPVDIFFNVLDNCTIKRITMRVDGHRVHCDLITYPNKNKVRLEYCNSKTSKISDGSFYF